MANVNRPHVFPLPFFHPPSAQSKFSVESSRTRQPGGADAEIAIMHANVDDSKSRIRAVSSGDGGPARAPCEGQPVVLPVMGHRLGGFERMGMARQAIYRLPLIEDDDLTRSYNRLGSPESQ